jgi:hypothetical protein
VTDSKADCAEIYAYSVPEDVSGLYGRLDLRPAGGPLIAYSAAGHAEIVDIAHPVHDVPVTIEYSSDVDVDITSAQRWENADGSVFALVMWEEWPREGGWKPTP